MRPKSDDTPTLWYEPAARGGTISNDSTDVPHATADDADEVRTPPAGVVIKTQGARKPSDTAIPVSINAVEAAFGPDWTAGLHAGANGGNEQTRQLLAGVAAGPASLRQSRYRVQVAPTAAHHPATMPRTSTIIVTDADTGAAVMVAALGPTAPQAWSRATPADCWRPMRVTKPRLPSSVAEIVDAAAERRPECPRVRTLLNAAATYHELKRRSINQVELTYIDRDRAERTDRTTTAVFLDRCWQAFRPARHGMGRRGWVIDLQQQDGARCQLRKRHWIQWHSAGGWASEPSTPANPETTAEAVNLIERLLLLPKADTAADWPDGPEPHRLLRTRGITG